MQEIPTTGGSTTQMVADYYNVPPNTIRMLVTRNKDILMEFGHWL